MKKTIQQYILVVIVVFMMSAGFAFAQEVEPILGCTDPTATNYNASATQDDGSCIAPTPTSPPEPTPTPTPAPPPTPTTPTDIIPPTVQEPLGKTDFQPPAAIRDAHIQRLSPKSADIAWTTPSDNEKVTGYDTRISLQPINENNWSEAIQVGGIAQPHDSGEPELVGLADLPSSTTIYFAVRSYDAAGNYSRISNVLSFTTKKLENNGVLGEQGGADSNRPGALTPTNAGTVRMVVQAPDGGVPSDLIFINFIDLDNGLSFGATAFDGLVAVSLPEGRYKIRMLLPPNWSEPTGLSEFNLSDGENIDLGIVRLNSGTGSTDFLASVDQPGGIAKALMYIIQILLEILKELKDIRTML